MNNYTDITKWKFGAEHELADWDIRSTLPSSVKRNLDDYSIVNSNGIANDPSGKLVTIGGELNTAPTDTIYGQVEILKQIKEALPDAKTNYHSNLHLHISIPGLSEDLEMLKYIQRRIHQDMPVYLGIIDPLEYTDYPTDADYKVARHRINHSKISRHKLLSEKCLMAQMEATTLDDFFNSEPPKSKAGKPMFHLAPRVCINLRSLRDNGTIEFRHWAGTMDLDKFRDAFIWCQMYLMAIFEQRDVITDLENNDFYRHTKQLNLPRQEPVDVKLERLFRLTSCHQVDREVAAMNISKILNGEAL